MENDVLQRKYQFLKRVSDACRIQAYWKNSYGTRLTKVDDGVAIVTQAMRKMENQGFTPTNAMR